MDYIRRYYRVPAKRGGLVCFEGKPGVIVGTRLSYLRVRLGGHKHLVNLHPTEVEYL